MRKSTSQTPGVNVELAMKHLASIGIGPEAIALETGVTVRTARRWAQGRQQPRKSNLVLLRRRLGTMRDDASWRGLPRRWVPVLEAALDALFPPFAQRLADVEEKRLARLRREREAQKADKARWEQHFADRGPVQSVTAAVDPFALIAA